MKTSSSALLAFVRGIHRWPVNSPNKRANNADNVFIWWRQHDVGITFLNCMNSDYKFLKIHSIHGSNPLGCVRLGVLKLHIYERCSIYGIPVRTRYAILVYVTVELILHITVTSHERHGISHHLNLIVCSTAFSGYQRYKNQNCALYVPLEGVNLSDDCLTKGQCKPCPYHDVIMKPPQLINKRMPFCLSILNAICSNLSLIPYKLITWCYKSLWHSNFTCWFMKFIFLSGRQTAVFINLSQCYFI